MEIDFAILLTKQQFPIVLKSYKNEFETMLQLWYNLPAEQSLSVRNSILRALKDLENTSDVEFNSKTNIEKIQESKDLRQKGNRLFTGRDCKRNILGACHLYTDAIYAALDAKGDEQALGFANRAIALQTFGYYKQAYDDCVCAIKLGYPKPLRHKIIMRLAYCSIKNKDLIKAEKHLNELQELNLSDGFCKELEELLKSFNSIKNEMGKKQRLSNGSEATLLNKETQEIINTEKGRSMLARCLIKKNQLIFTERASAMVPVNDTRQICHQCGTLYFIPIPCLHCRGRVNYCSLKCQKDHVCIHMYECPGYRMNLFSSVGIGHLALRIILDNGFLTVLDELKLNNESTTYGVWRKLTEGDVWKNSSIPYGESLRMITHLNKCSYADIKMYALCSYTLTVYLKQYTKYFDILNAANKNIEWELLIGSLILRHTGQSIFNAHSLLTINPRPITTCFHMLNENVWSSPWYIKLGCLHFFCNFDIVATLNLPYLSLCNHSCVPSFQTKFSGRFISTYASFNLKAGDEINNCYNADYRSRKRKQRRRQLQKAYHFACQCEDCLRTDNEDVEFNKFHQYRCDQSECGKIFVPDTLGMYIDESIDNLICNICDRKQTQTWYFDSVHLMSATTSTGNRRHLYKIFKESEQYLVGLNVDRCFLAEIIVHDWFKLPFKNVPLIGQDYCDLIDMLKFILNVKRERNSVNSLEFVTEMLYLWDLIAQRKYKCSKADMDEMLWALSIISDDLKVIILNYYNSYIKELITS